MNDNFDFDNENNEYNDYDPEVLDQIRLTRLRRERADQLARDRLHAEMIMVAAAIIIVAVVVMLITKSIKKSKSVLDSANARDSSSSAAQSYEPEESGTDDVTLDSAAEIYKDQAEGHSLTVSNGIYYVDGIMIVNKTFCLPSTYDPGLDPEASAAFDEMAAQAWSEGISLWICSGYRNYDEQETLFTNYATQRGLEAADEVSARPGHSEHQSGLCMDVNSTEFSFAETQEAQWLANHCAEYGFIIRFPEGKEDITGYTYEPWHIRYVGVENAQKITESGLCLEEYLGVTSDYADSPENADYVEQYSQYSDSQE